MNGGKQPLAVEIDEADGGALAAGMDCQYRAALLGFFRRRGCAAALAEDLTQDVFLKVVAYLACGEIADLRSFVFKVAANRLRDTSRSTRRWREAPLDEAQEIEPQLVEYITPERILQGRQDVAVVVQAFSELDMRTQRIFLMNRFDHLRHRDIADHLELSVSSIEKSLRAARRHLATTDGRPAVTKNAPISESFAATLAGVAEQRAA